LERAVADLGPMERRQYSALAVLVATVAGWVFFGGGRLDLGVIALLGTAALFALRVLRWEQVERHIFWNIVLMYGGAIALGAALERTGATRFVLERVIGGGHPATLLHIPGGALM